MDRLNFCASVLKCFNLHCFHPIQVLARSVSIHGGERGSSYRPRFSRDKTRKLWQTREQRWEQNGSCNGGNLIWIGKKFLIKRREKKGNRGFSQLLNSFGKSLDKRHGASRLTLKRWHASSVSTKESSVLLATGWKNSEEIWLAHFKGDWQNIHPITTSDSALPDLNFPNIFFETDMWNKTSLILACQFICPNVLLVF